MSIPADSHHPQALKMGFVKGVALRRLELVSRKGGALRPFALRSIRYLAVSAVHLEHDAI